MERAAIPPAVEDDEGLGDEVAVQEELSGERRRGTFKRRLGALEEEVRRMSLAVDAQQESLDMVHEQDYIEFAAERVEARRCRE